MSREPIVVRSTSVAATREIAAALAELARPYDLLLLVGDLGAGKTAFTQGFGQGLGVEEPITSPTFALVRGYRGRLGLHHLDVYRLEQINEALDLGLSELLDDASVTVIEWGDTITQALPRDYLEVRLTHQDDDDHRLIEFTPCGSQWRARARAMSVALAAWGLDPDDATGDAAAAGDAAATGDHAAGDGAGGSGAGVGDEVGDELDGETGGETC